MAADLVAVRRENSSRQRNTLLAAAKRITGETVKRLGRASKDDGGWQADAWDLTELVGEQSFIVNMKAGRVGAGRFYAGRLNPDDPTARPEMLNDEHPASRILKAWGDTGAQKAQLMSRMSVNLSVPGDGWWIGVPSSILNPPEEQDIKPSYFIKPEGEDDKVIDIEDLKWFMLSISEVTKDNDRYNLKIGSKTYRGIHPDDIWMIRVWDPDPRWYDKATSATRAVLPVLRELHGLTMHVSAQIDSRLAGAGAWMIPQSAVDAVVNQMDDPPGPDDLDPFTASILEAGTTAISDRSSAAALMPVGLVVPDDSLDSAGAWKHISFSTPLDKEARQLREEAIRRLALGQAVPPEILLGVGNMNHWGAWLVKEDTISTHVEPQLQLMCDALTTQYLWPVLEQQENMGEEAAQEFVIWYDVDHLISRPNKLEDAVALHTAGVISDAALRDAGQFTDEDAQISPAFKNEAASLVLRMIQTNPSLIRNPGIQSLVDSVSLLLEGDDVPEVDEIDEDAAGPTDEADETALPNISEEGPPTR